MQIGYAHLAFLSLMMMAVGCGRSNSNLPKLMPVSGVVTLDGKPLAGVGITFIPVGSTRGNGASGHTDKTGKYELTALHGGKGTPAGDYRVTVSNVMMPDGANFPASSSVAPVNAHAQKILPAKYSDREQTTLKATVHEGANTIDLPLSSAH